MLREWSTLTCGDINLHRWTDFKKSVLQYGLAHRRNRNKSTTNRWKEILHGNAISTEELEELTFDWNSHPEKGNARSQAADSVHEPGKRVLPAGQKDPINTRKAVLYPDVSASRQKVDTKLVLTPNHPAAVPTDLPLPSVADQLDIRLVAMRKAQLRKYKEMERLHTSEWYQLSSNKEKDERGSRASISVEGL